MLNFIKEYWLEFIFSTALAGLTVLLKKLYSRFKQEILTQKLINQGMIAILHDRIYQLCTDYIKCGNITVDELENLEYLYKSYHSLGGNGTGTALYERCRTLKIENA